MHTTGQVGKGKKHGWIHAGQEKQENYLASTTTANWFSQLFVQCKVPGRAFVRRLYSLGSNEKLLPHHHIRINEECRLEMEIWMKFLDQPLMFSRDFMDCIEQSAEDVDMYSDASGCSTKGFGAYCRNRWTGAAWDKEWIEVNQPSIEYLELYAVTVAVLLWIREFKNSRILLHCDNVSICTMINKTSSGCRNCMVLIRLIVLECLVHNVHLQAEWVPTGDNGKADAIFRLEFQRFRRLGPDMELWPVEMPSDIWPVTKILVKNQ